MAYLMTRAKWVLCLILRNRNLAIPSVCGALLLHSASASAVEPPKFLSRTWQIEDGLPQNTVQALAQGRDGYLWVGTTRGLARFDGVHFTVFDSDNTPAISNASISALCLAGDGALWMGTAGGGLVELRHGNFTAVSLGTNESMNTVRCLAEGKDGALWVGTVEGLFCFRRGKWSHFTVRDGLASNVVRSVCDDGERVWIGTALGINYYKSGAIRSQPFSDHGGTTSIRTVFCDRAGRLWVGFTGGLAKLQDGTFTYFSRKHGLPDNNVGALTEDRNGNLWIGTYGGLCRYVDGKFAVEKDNAGQFYDQVNALLEDDEGDLWTGGRDGLHELRARRFLAYTRKEGLPHDNVMSVMEDHRGHVWVSTWGGGLAEMKGGRVMTYNWENSLKKGLSTDLILSLCEDSDGSLFLGTDYEGGTFRFDGNSFSGVWNNDSIVTNRVVRVIYRDRAGSVWFGASPGLVLGGSEEQYLPAATIRSMAEDADGVLWVGSDAGVFRRTKAGFEPAPLPRTLERETITALHVDGQNTLWIGTAHHGLGCWKDGHFALYTTREGLWSDEIFEILEDNHGWLWMSCSRGIFRVRKANLSAFEAGRTNKIDTVAYGKADGLESIQCNGVCKPAGWKSRDGRLWFATTKGVVVTDPILAERMNGKIPAVRVETVLADRNPIAVRHADRAPLQISPGRGELEFHYTALSLAAPEQNRFRYRLKGVDPDWVDAGGRRVAYYNNLPAGDYEFQVMAANNDGLWNREGDRVRLSLQPHFWQVWWFTGSAATAMVGMIGVTVRYASRKKLQIRLERLEKQHAIERERSRIARDMHDELGARLTEILLLNELAQKSNPGRPTVEENLTKQSQMIQEAAGSLDAIVWAVNPVNDSLEHLADYLCEQVERFLSMRSIRCRFDLPDVLPDYSVPSEVRHNVFLIVREALNNVVKHSGATEVKFRLRAVATTLSVDIEDNGRGFSPGHGRSSGNGLHNMVKRMKNLGGTLKLVTSPGSGTSIHLEVPVTAYFAT